MHYSDQLADEIILIHGLTPSVKYRWASQGAIPDNYFQNGFVKPKPLTKRQNQQQEKILDVMRHPIILHTGFSDSVNYDGKIDEMLTLRRGLVEQPPRIRDVRPNPSMLNFLAHELKSLAKQLRELAKVMRDTLVLAKSQPYERRQETLKELLRGRKELTTRQTVAKLSESDAGRWRNFVSGARKVLPQHYSAIVAHVIAELQDLLTVILSALISL